MVLGLKRFFLLLADSIHDYWCIYILAPVVLTLLLATGFALMDMRTVDVVEHVFVPTNGRSHYELDVLQHYWPLEPNRFIPGQQFGMKYWIEVVLTAKKGNNILEAFAINEAWNFSRYMQEELHVTGGNGSYYYSDVCLQNENRCFVNSIVDFLKHREGYQNFIDLTYPRANLASSPIYVANVVGGVVLSDDEGHIESAKGMLFLYYLREDNATACALSEKWLYAAEHYVTNFESEHIDVALFHTYSIRDSLFRGVFRFMPKFSVTFFVLITFSTACSFVCVRVPRPNSSDGREILVPDWTKSKPNLALLGVVAAGMAIVSGMGCLLLTGIVEYHTIVITVPFLVMSIGVDDMFIMMAAWHRSDSSLSVKERIRVTMSEAAVSITISSFTDVMSFSVGAITFIPGVQMFCVYAAISILFVYIYQVTFYAAWMVVSGKYEKMNRHCILFWREVESPEGAKNSWRKALLLCGSQTSSLHSESSSAEFSVTHDKSLESVDKPYSGNNVMTKTHTETDNRHEILSRRFATILLSPISQVLVLLFAQVYLICAIWGVFEMRQGLEMKNLLLPDDYAVKWYDMSANYFFTEGPQLHVIFNNPPRNLASRAEREKFELAVHAFEGTKHTMLRNATQFWYYEYLNYLRTIGYNLTMPEVDTEDIWVARLKHWLRGGGGERAFKLDVIWGDPNSTQADVMLAFRFVIGLRQFSKINDHKDSAALVRSIAQRFPEYNITTWHQYWPYADQYMTTLDNTIQDCYIALAVMAVLSVIMIPGVISTVLIGLTIISVDVGILGYMTFWNVNLDAISMITVIMSSGFSIDYAAHTCHAFMTAKGPPKERMIEALSHVGFPVLQGALSAIFGIVVLASADSYMIQTFFKTVFLVIAFGLLHGMVVLPIVLTHCATLKKIICDKFPIKRTVQEIRDNLIKKLKAINLKLETLCKPPLKWRHSNKDNHQ